jgi:hypothetical protein
MREIRLSGSEGGWTGPTQSSLPLFAAEQGQSQNCGIARALLRSLGARIIVRLIQTLPAKTSTRIVDAARVCCFWSAGACSRFVAVATRKLASSQGTSKLAPAKAAPRRGGPHSRGLRGEARILPEPLP